MTDQRQPIDPEALIAEVEAMIARTREIRALLAKVAPRRERQK